MEAGRVLSSKEKKKATAAVEKKKKKKKKKRNRRNKETRENRVDREANLPEIVVDLSLSLLLGVCISW